MIGCEHQPKIKPKNQGPTPNDSTVTSTKCDKDTIYFVNEILPIFNSSCAQEGCHNAISKQDGVQLDNYSSIMSTGDVKPGKPNDSKVYEVIVTTKPGDKMPPNGSLTQDQINKIKKWIEQGAKNNYCNSICDTTVFTFSGAVSKIISTNCTACHSSGNIVLTSYAGVKARVDDGRLWGAINHLQGYRFMPSDNIFLSECDRKIIKKWIDSGAANN